MFSINTNLGSYAALASLMQTQEALNTTQQQLATGKKVSSAADNPAIYAISNTMNAELAGQMAVSDSLAFGIACVGVASSAVSSISDTLAKLKQTVTQGQQTGIDPAIMNNQIAALCNNIDAYAQSATFNGVNLIAGTTSKDITTDTLQVPIDTIGNLFVLPETITTTITTTTQPPPVTTTTQSMVQAFGENDGSIRLTAGTTLSTDFTVSSANVGWTFVLDQGNNGLYDGSPTANAAVMDGLLRGIGPYHFPSTFQANPSASGGIVPADGSGGTVTDLGNNSAVYHCPPVGVPTMQFNIIRVNVASVAGGPGSPGLGPGVGNIANIARALATVVGVMNQIGFQASINSSNRLIMTGNNLTIAAGGQMLSGITQVSSNASNPGHPLTDVMSVTTTTTPPPIVTTTTTTVQDDLTATSTALGLTGLTVGSPNTVATVDAAIAKLGTISSTLGSGSQHLSGLSNFSSARYSALTAGVGALTDADMTEVSARLASLQTKQSLAVQSLSIANQQPQALLKLFGNG